MRAQGLPAHLLRELNTQQYRKTGTQGQLSLAMAWSGPVCVSQGGLPGRQGPDPVASRFSPGRRSPSGPACPPPPRPPRLCPSYSTLFSRPIRGSTRASSAAASSPSRFQDSLQGRGPKVSGKRAARWRGEDTEAGGERWGPPGGWWCCAVIRETPMGRSGALPKGPSSPGPIPELLAPQEPGKLGTWLSQEFRTRGLRGRRHAPNCAPFTAVPSGHFLPQHLSHGSLSIGPPSPLSFNFKKLILGNVIIIVDGKLRFRTLSRRQRQG